VVLTVRVSVAAAAPVMFTEVRGMHVTGLVAPVGLLVVAQARATVPVNPFAGVTVMVEVLPVVAPAIKLRVVGLLLTANVGAAVTVTFTVVFCEMAPEVPVTVTT